MLLGRENGREFTRSLMNYQEHTQPNGLLSLVSLISRYRWFVLVITIITTGAFYGFNVAFNDFEYRSDAQVMVVQYSDNVSVDGEKTQRSTENISRNLTKVISTSSFIDKALANPTVPAGMIAGNTDREKKDSWTNKVTASTLPNSSIIQVSVYDTDPQKAAMLAQAVADTLIANAADYHGANKTAIALKQIDKVLTSDTAVRPNIPMVTFAGFLVGLIGSIFYLFLVKEWKLVATMSAEWQRANNTDVQDVRRAVAQEAVQDSVAPAPVVASVDMPQAEVQVTAPVMNVAPQPLIQAAPLLQTIEQDIVQEVQKIEQEVVHEVQQIEQEAEDFVEAAQYYVLDHLNWKNVLPLNVLRMQTAPQVVTIPQPIV
jgi:capsular polysaccharide biosynthesis protein